MSASRTPTRRPAEDSAAARLTVSDDLPTPPLPLATARTRVERSTRDPLRALGDAAAELRRQRCLLLGRHDVERHGRPLDARHGADVLRDLILEARPERAAGDCERDRRPSRRRPRSRSRAPCRGRSPAAAARGRSTCSSAFQISSRDGSIEVSVPASSREATGGAQPVFPTQGGEKPPATRSQRIAEVRTRT